MSMSTHTYAFHLGHHPTLSVAEMYAVLSQERRHVSSYRQVGEYALIGTDVPLDPASLMQTLGGTRLIAERIAPHGNAESTIQTYLEALPSDKKMHFSISGGKVADRVAITVKKYLTGIGRSVRFVKAVNTAVILHNRLVERGSHLTIIDNVVYVTRAIQPIEDMTTRDYGRPSIDDKSGMLPPKLARMMVNLAMPTKEAVLLDPFCGSGTLLGEAMSLGLQHITGSDISAKAVSDSKENLSWLEKNLGAHPTLRMLEADVRSLPKTLEHNSVDIIATEPYMGVPRKGKEARQFLVDQSRELSSLYIDAFHVFAQILKPGGRVVFVIPRFLQKEEWITIDIAERIERLGFARLPFEPHLPMPLFYHRDGQFVGRELWRFEKK